MKKRLVIELVTELVIEEPELENVHGSAAMGATAKTTSANTNLTPMEADVHLRMEIEQQEHEVKVAETMPIETIPIRQP